MWLCVHGAIRLMMIHSFLYDESKVRTPYALAVEKRSACEAGATFSGATDGWPIAFAMRSLRSWSTAANTDTVNTH